MHGLSCLGEEMALKLGYYIYPGGWVYVYHWEALETLFGAELSAFYLYK